MQTSRGILKKKITRKVILLEIVSWCSLISLGWCWALPLKESFLKSCTSKLGIIKGSGNGNSPLENNFYSLTLWLALGVEEPESKEPNVPYLPSIFHPSLFISYWSLWEDPLDGPQWSCLLGLHPCVFNSLPLCVDWTLCLFSSEKHVAKMVGCHFQDQVTKKLWFLSEAPFLLLLAYLEWSQLLHSELSMERLG